MLDEGFEGELKGCSDGSDRGCTFPTGCKRLGVSWKMGCTGKREEEVASPRSMNEQLWISRAESKCDVDEESI